MKEPSECLEKKHATNPLSWRANCWCLLHQQDIGWSRSHVPVPIGSCELRRTTEHCIVYPGSAPFYMVIVLHLVFLCIEDEQYYNGGELRAQKVR
jgi:hypothetical protein